MVWGVAYLAEAMARVFIVEFTSTGAALASVQGDALRRRRRARRLECGLCPPLPGEQGSSLGAAAHARGEVPPSDARVTARYPAQAAIVERRPAGLPSPWRLARQVRADF